MRRFIVIIIGMLFINCSAQKIYVPNEVPIESPLKTDKTMVLCLSPVNEFRASFETAIKFSIIGVYRL